MNHPLDWWQWMHHWNASQTLFSANRIALCALLRFVSFRSIPFHSVWIRSHRIVTNIEYGCYAALMMRIATMLWTWFASRDVSVLPRCHIILSNRFLLLPRLPLLNIQQRIRCTLLSFINLTTVTFPHLYHHVYVINGCPRFGCFAPKYAQDNKIGFEF